MPDAETHNGFVPPEVFQGLVRKGAPLYGEALAITPATSAAEIAAPEEDQLAAHHMRATTLAIQALLAGTPLSPQGIMLTMGASVGALLGQCPMELYQGLYDAFQSQFAATLAQVSLAQRKAING